MRTPRSRILRLGLVEDRFLGLCCGVGGVRGRGAKFGRGEDLGVSGCSVEGPDAEGWESVRWGVRDLGVIGLGVEGLGAVGCDVEAWGVGCSDVAFCGWALD